MLVLRDSRAYAAQDWKQVAGDFLAEQFFAVNAFRNADPSSWMPAYATLDDYRDDWLKQAAETAQAVDMDSFVESILGIVDMKQIDINGQIAIAHKKFDGHLQRKDGGEAIHLNWQTLYQCRQVDGAWKIAGFVGYLPNDG